MRVGIYNRWLKTMGGGEKYSGAIAANLAGSHDVQFLTHEPVDLDEFGERLGLRLGRVGVRIVEDLADFSAVRDASADYDLFVNASHLDFFAPRARRNVLIVYFPATSIERARALGGYNRAKQLVRRNAGWLIGAGARAHLRRLVFGRSGQSSDQTIVGRLALGAFRLVSTRGQQDQVLDGYDRIVTISVFSQRWIERYWRRHSEVLYPPVDVASFAPGEKRRQILGVGRFFAGNHNKKHLALIEAFRRLEAAPLADWELHLAGGFAPSASNLTYLDEVRRAAADSRIHLHVNCGYEELRGLYRESTLFWHATGLGEDETAHPERFEHFGLTTVEAMAAACVPIVYRAGGQPEIVRSGVDGILWSTTDELIATSVELARDEVKRRRIASAARDRARDFDLPAFQARLQELLL